MSLDQSGSVSQGLVHHAVTASTRISSETSLKSDLSPAAIPESPSMNRGGYPYNRGEVNALIYHTAHQRWEVVEYKYFVTVLKYILLVSVLYSTTYFSDDFLL